MDRAAYLTGLYALMREGFHDVKVPARVLRNALVTLAKTQGIDGVRRDYNRLWVDLFGRPRARAMERYATRAALHRARYLTEALHARYPHHLVPHFAPSTVSNALRTVLVTPRGRTGWRPIDHWWPRDIHIKHMFFRYVAEAQRRHETHVGIMQAAAAKKPPPVKIDPTLKKFAYPIDPDLLDVDMVERAADFMVVGRGEYWAMLGMRDLMRSADTAVGRALSGETALITGWEWTLSPQHDKAPTSPDICDEIAEFDAGHPDGPGIYFDLLLPESHPNCWCNLQPHFADPADAADPEWSPPEPPDDYVERVRGLIEGITGRPMLAIS